ncbi:pentapeptide repeat-containing protein [Paenibacillus sp. JQZ6Y-1]
MWKAAFCRQPLQYRESWKTLSGCMSFKVFCDTVTVILECISKHWKGYIPMITINCIGNDSIQLDISSLQGANLNGLELHRAILSHQDVSYSSLVCTNLRGAELFQTNLSHSVLTSALLMTAYLQHANLEYSNLSQARCAGADFQGSNLSQSTFTQADIWKADFTGANLKGVIMLCERISDAIFTNAIYDDSTIWPSFFDPALSGAIKV